MTLRYYKRRMWIEEMFGDLKGQGFDLESTHASSFLTVITPDLCKQNMSDNIAPLRRDGGLSVEADDLCMHTA